MTMKQTEQIINILSVSNEHVDKAWITGTGRNKKLYISSVIGIHRLPGNTYLVVFNKQQDVAGLQITI